MRVPRVLHIAGREWSVHLTDDVDEEGFFSEDAALHGWCWREKREIRIDSDLDADDRASTLLHEILHAVLPDWSEARVAECEQALWPVLRDNGLWRRR